MWADIKEWLRRRWLWIAGALAALLGLLIARSQGVKAGKAEVASQDTREALNKADEARIRLKKLNQERVKILADIAAEAAARTKALDEDLSEEEVLKRLKEKGLVK